MKYTYSVETFYLNQWVALIKDEQRGFAHGYFFGRKDTVIGPRLECRFIRSDGKVIDSYPATNDVSLGMIAGFPSPEQYEQAAEKALKTAKQIRERVKKNETK